MATVAQVAKASLQRILVQASEADLEPDEYQDYIFALNNFMLSLVVEGVDLGFTEVSNLADEVTVPSGAIRGIIANMAIEVSPDYNGTISQGLVLAAKDGLNTMRLLSMRQEAGVLPPTMPLGSGTEYDIGYNNDHFNTAFYPKALIELGAYTTLITAINKAEIIGGTWTEDYTELMKHTASGRLTYLDSSTRKTIITANATLEPASGTVDIEIHISINGVIYGDTIQSVTAGSAVEITTEFEYYLSINDYIELFVINKTSTENIVSTKASIKVEI